jgi:hypothetical protein
MSYTISNDDLARIQAIFGPMWAQMTKEVGTLSKTSKKSAPVADKKPRANAGQPTAHGAYTAKVLAEHDKNSAEFKAYVAKRVADAEAGKLIYTADQGKVKSGKKAVGDLMDAKEAVAGAHIPFAAQWKRDHQEEWNAFKAEFEAAHPKSSRTASVADDASVAESAVASEASEPKAKKARKPMTEEAKKAAAAKRAATKAAKSAPVAPVAEPAVVDDKAVEEDDVSVADEEEAEEAAEEAASVVSVEVDASADALITWTSPKKVDYLRIGHLDDEGDGVWNEGNWLWVKNADGSKGDYAGILLASGKIDSSPATLADEPEI